MTERLRRTTWSRAIRVSLAFVVAGSMVSVATAGRGIADPITGHGVVAPPIMVNLGVNVNGLSTDAKTNLVDVATFAGVQVIRGRTNQVTASIPHPTVYGGYVGPSVDPHRDLICVASYSFTTTPSLVYVINGRTNKVIRKMSAGGPCEDGIAINPVTNRLYVPNNVTGRVSVIDAATAKLVTTSNVGGRLGVAAIDATTNTIYVTHLEVGYSPASPTSVIDGRTDKVLGAVSTGYEPLNLGVDQETHRVYVADLAKSTIYVLTNFDHGRHTVKIGEFKLTAFGIAVDSFNHKVIATGDNSSEVWIVNESTNKVIRTVTTGGQPETLTIDTTNHCAYAFLYGTTQVAIVSGV